jgi:ATP-binding cassette subfamily B (MDR/TAP) protein 1
MAEQKPEKKSRFRRRKKEEKQNEEEVIFIDPAEPKIRSNFPIFRYMGPECGLIFFGLFGAALGGAIPLVMYEVLGGLINGLTASTAGVATSEAVVIASGVLQQAQFTQTVINAAIYMSILAAVAWLASLVQHGFMNLAHDRFGTRLKIAFFNSLLDQEIGYFDMKRTGQLVNDLAETELVQDAYSTKFGEIFKNMIQGVLGIILGLIAGWQMALIMLSAAPLLIVTLGGAGSLTRFFVAKITAKMNGAASVANEVISSMRTVRSMDGEEKEKDRYTRELKRAESFFIFKAISLGISIGLVSFFIWGAIALGFWFGGTLSVRGQLTIGNMFKVFGLNLIAVIGLLMGMQLLPDLRKAEPAIRNMLKVIKRKPQLRPSGGKQPGQIIGHIEFKNVCFTYPTRPNVQVLKDFNLEIKPGQTVALVGASGSGKSTIVGLLEKFYVPDSGQIILDDQDLNEIDPRWLHRNIGIVTQEPTLFAGTIRDNILYAVSELREVSDDEIRTAAIAANAHDFIMQLPNGYDTVLGERGVSLSGGQKQRVAIARAMIQNPKLLLLDEATSALDTQAESIVQDALNKLMKGRTTIVIAHRLATVVDADLIVVMHKGEIKEKGTHHELLQIPNGYYYRLAKKQMMMAMGSNEASNGKNNEKKVASPQIIENQVVDNSNVENTIGNQTTAPSEELDNNSQNSSDLSLDQ